MSKQYEISGPDGKTYEVTAPDEATQDEVLARVKSEASKSSSAEAPPPVSIGNAPERFTTNLIRNIGTAAGGLFDTAAMLPKAALQSFARQGAGTLAPPTDYQPNYSQGSQTAGQLSDAYSLASDTESPGGVYGGAIERALASTVMTAPLFPAGLGTQAAVATSGALGGELAKQSGAGAGGQLAATLAAGGIAGLGSGLANTVKNFSNDPSWLNSMFGSGAQAARDIAEPAAMRASLSASKAASSAEFTGQYAARDAAQPMMTPPPSMASVPEWAMPVGQAEKLIPSKLTNFNELMTNKLQNFAVGDPTIAAAESVVRKIDTSTVKGIADARTIILDLAFKERGQTRKQLFDMAAGLQEDMDNSLMSDMGKQLSARYKAQVKDPYRALENRGALAATGPPERVWQTIRKSPASQNAMLLNAVGTDSRAAIKAASVRDVADAIVGKSTTSARAVVNELERNGLGSSNGLWTPEEWAGIRNIAVAATSSNSFVSRFGLRGAAAIVGGMTGKTTITKVIGAEAGYQIQKQMETMIRSAAGRVFLTRLGTQTPKQVNESMGILFSTPAILDAWQADQS